MCAMKVFVKPVRFEVNVGKTNRTTVSPYISLNCLYLINTSMLYAFLLSESLVTNSSQAFNLEKCLLTPKFHFSLNKIFLVQY